MAAFVFSLFATGALSISETKEHAEALVSARWSSLSEDDKNLIKGLGSGVDFVLLVSGASPIINKIGSAAKSAWTVEKAAGVVAEVRRVEAVVGAAEASVGKEVGTAGVKAAGKLTIGAGEFSASERMAAQHMADLGNDVVLRAPVGTRVGGGTSDLLVNGVPYDVYTPITSNPNRIVSALASKNSQA